MECYYDNMSSFLCSTHSQATAFASLKLTFVTILNIVWSTETNLLNVSTQIQCLTLYHHHTRDSAVGILHEANILLAIINPLVTLALLCRRQSSYLFTMHAVVLIAHPGIGD